MDSLEVSNINCFNCLVLEIYLLTISLFVHLNFRSALPGNQSHDLMQFYICLLLLVCIFTLLCEFDGISNSECNGN